MLLLPPLNPWKAASSSGPARRSLENRVPVGRGPIVGGIGGYFTAPAVRPLTM